MSVLERWEPVIGLEVHVQLGTASKIFCGCSTAFGAPPNAHTCPVCAGHPGALPVLNRMVVEHALTLGLALGCALREQSIWARKNYFYPDLPKGYQISQYEHPICEHGRLRFPLEGGGEAEASIVRIHMEEDAGKSVHVAGGGRSLVDLNRAGIPLLEVVSGPDLHGGEEAASYLRALRQLVRWLGISDGNMQEGSLRCDANVSLRRRGELALGTRAEVKNLNSFRFVQKAIEHEIVRQAGLLENGERVVQETRLYDPDRDETRSLRSKEEAHDYRYFPDPDLPPLVLDPAQVARLTRALPELPIARARRFEGELGLPPADARVLTAERALADWFEAAVDAYPGEAKKVANWMQTEVLRWINEGGLGALRVTPGGLARLLTLIDAGTVSASAAKEILLAMVETGAGPEALVRERGLEQVSDVSALEALVEEVVAASPEQVEAYRSGKANLLGWFVGQVMRRSRGKANPKMVGELVRSRLEA